MRISPSLIIAGLLLGSFPLMAEKTAAEETTVTPRANAAPTLTVEQPVNPVASKPGGPIIQSVSVRLGVQAGNVILDIVPDFHYIAPNGNAVLLHREVVSTSAGTINLNPNSVINTPADAQKQGAVVSGGWRCNVTPYYVTMKAYIMDAEGGRSNEVQYTVHCNGG
jgi:hypothetical protein